MLTNQTDFTVQMIKLFGEAVALGKANAISCNDLNLSVKKMSNVVGAQQLVIAELISTLSDDQLLAMQKKLEVIRENETEGNVKALISTALEMLT